MNLLIDAGNTRIKWALVKDGKWLREGALPIERAFELPLNFANLQDIDKIWVSNVAGEEVARHVDNIGAGQTHFIVAQKFQCGVCNGYTKAGQLGSDRWAALIAAWHLVHDKCLVVNCGTATTIDTLSAQGDFMGGLILPGIELMQQNLRNATNLPETSQGKYKPFPSNTADALFSGAIQAICGAIQRQKTLINDSHASVILSGGAAAELLPYIGIPVRSIDNLVLRGLLLIAQDADTK